MEGIRGTFKNWVYRDVMSEISVIDTPKPFVEHADKAVKGINSLYLSAKDVLIEPDDIEVSPGIKDTLSIHMIKRFFDEQNVPYLKSLYDENLFFTQFYG